MKINVTMPFDHIEWPEEFVTPEAVVEVAQTADRLGFNAALVTDHPVPSARWLDNGGHYAQDPFVMLSLIAAATKRIRLQTGVLVLPYRNPFIVARSASTLDVFSKGRLTLSVGAGYMKAEYKALGVDFERRNDIMDEYIAAMKAAWTGEDFTFKGEGYEALGNRMRPAPLQKGGVPIYIGGNSKRAIRRAVEMADGWNPFFTPAAISATARTTAMTDEMDLAQGIAYMKEHCEKVGRAKPPELVLASTTHPGDEWNPQKLIDKIKGYEEMGVTAVGSHMDGKTRREWCDNAQRFAEDVLSKV